MYFYTLYINIMHKNLQLEMWRNCGDVFKKMKVKGCTLAVHKYGINKQFMI